jgi:hypothetical protein
MSACLLDNPASSVPAAVEVRPLDAFSDRERDLMQLAGLSGLATVEAWRVLGTSRQLASSTHGVFRYFGKFPPPLARHLIQTLTAPGDRVLDPMAGSGTTAVEALALQRHVEVRDISPLSALLCRVKTRQVPRRAADEAIARVVQRRNQPLSGPPPSPVGLRNPEHWFLPETTASLASLRAAIEPETEVGARELLLTAFASTVRRVSRATTQQGRLFLDVDKAKADAWPTFLQRFEKYATAVASLPPERGVTLEVREQDARQPSPTSGPFRLAIVHPPYFNNYRYSAINSLELAWLGFPPKDVRADEIREAFKVGKPEKVADYVQDLAAVVAAVAGQLAPQATLALMMGDTVIRDRYLDVTRQLLTAIADTDAGLRLDRIVLRVPQFTEASWVASQRRKGDKVGVTLHDFVLLFSKVGGAA